MGFKTRASHCATCHGIPDRCEAFLKAGELITALPAAVDRLKVWTRAPGYLGDYSVSRGNSHIKRCPACGALFLYECSYEFLANGSEDDIWLTRLTDPVVTLQQLCGHEPARDNDVTYRETVALYTELADEHVRALVRSALAADRQARQRLERYVWYAHHLAGRPVFPDEAVDVLLQLYDYLDEARASTARPRRNTARSTPATRRRQRKRARRKLVADWHARTLTVLDGDDEVLHIHSKKWNPERDALLSADGKWLATVHDGRKDRVYVWNVDAKKIAHTLAFKRAYSEADLHCFSADGRLLLTSHNNGYGGQLFRAWDVAGEREVWSLKESDFHSPVVAFSPDGDLVAVADSWDGARVFRLGDGKRLFRFGGIAEHYPDSVAFTADSGAIVVHCGRKRQTWKLSPETNAIRCGHLHPVVDELTSPDGDHRLSRSKDEVFVWDRKGAAVLVLRTLAHAAAFSADGRQVITRYSADGSGFTSRFDIASRTLAARQVDTAETEAGQDAVIESGT